MIQTDSYMSGTNTVPVGAGLLAIAVDQLETHRLTHRYRGQARSHRGGMRCLYARYLKGGGGTKPDSDC